MILTDFEQAVQVVADEQGWTDRTLGELAFGFLVNAAPAQVRESFLAYAREIQHTENLTTDDEDI